MIIAIEICQSSFIYCKIWTQNLDVKTSKKPKERVKNQCLEIIDKKKKNIWLHNRNKNIIVGSHFVAQTQKNWVVSPIQ